MEAALNEHREQEKNLKATLLTAQGSPTTSRRRPSGKRKRIVREAEGRSDLLLEKTQARLEDIQREIDGLKLKRGTWRPRSRRRSRRCATRSNTSASRKRASATSGFCSTARDSPKREPRVRPQDAERSPRCQRQDRSLIEAAAGCPRTVTRLRMLDRRRRGSRTARVARKPGASSIALHVDAVDDRVAILASAS